MKNLFLWRERWGSTSQVKEILHDLCGKNRVYMKEPYCSGCVLFGLCSLVLWSLQCPLSRPDRNLPPKEISSRSCFFPSLPKSAKYLLKCAAHGEAKLELAAAPPGTGSWQSAAPSSSPGCCGRTACPLQKQPPIVFSLHVHMFHYCAAAPRVDEWSSSSLQNEHHPITYYSYAVACHHWLWNPTAGRDWGERAKTWVASFYRSTKMILLPSECDK